MLPCPKSCQKKVSRQMALAWKFPMSGKEVINLYPDQAYYRQSSPRNSTVITNLAQHLATHFVDPEAISENALQELSIIQVPRLSDDAHMSIQRGFGVI